MASYTIINKVPAQLSIEIDNWQDGKCTAYAITIPQSSTFDILPLAGSIENCKLVRGLANWHYLGMIEIVVEE
jgi:hypothetical protein